MSIQIAAEPASRLALSRPKCPSCGSILLMAEESRFHLRGSILHAWSCDDCGHEFVTTIRLWPRTGWARTLVG